MANESKKIIAMTLIVLIALSVLTTYAQPAVPMTVYGVVYIDAVPAGAGLTVYAKEGVTIIDQSLTSDTGTYTLALTGPAEGASIDLWVELENIATITMAYMGVLEQDLMVVTFVEYDIELLEGWNLISMPFEPEDSSIEVVLADILDNVNLVYAFDEETQTWSLYISDIPALATLTELVEDKGYWIYMETDDVLTVRGTGTGSCAPLDGKTVQIGYITSTTAQLETAIPLVEQIIEPDLNAYAESLGLDVTFEFLIENADGQSVVHLEKVQGFKLMDVPIFMGGMWSSQAQGSMSYVNDNDMLMVSSSSTSPLLAIENDRLFRTCPTDYVQGPAIAEMWSSWGAEAILIVQRGDSWADGIYNVLLPELESRGIEVIGRIRYPREAIEFSDYLGTMDNLLADAIAEYGADRVGVQTMQFDEGVVMMSQTGDFPNTRSVIWMGTESSGRSQRMIDYGGGMQVAVGGFSALMAPPNSWKWEDLNERYYEQTGQPASFYTATNYDAAWIIALSILQTQSTDASIVATALPEVSRNYYGASGWVDLDDAGDRKPGVFDIWGFTDWGFTCYGQYNGVDNSVFWDDAELAANGFTRPALIGN